MAFSGTARLVDPLTLGSAHVRVCAVQGPGDVGSRPTVWPRQLPDVPPVTQHLLEMRSGRLHVVDVDPQQPERVLPPDFALHEVLAASTDPAGVLELMRTWGLLATPGPDGRLGLGEARLRLRELQALARQVIGLRDGDPGAERAAWCEVAAARQVDLPDLTTAREWFRAALERGLQGFGVRVRLHAQGAPLAPDLFSAVALQLAHYLMSDTPLPRCGNDRCGRPFTVQRSPRRGDASSSHVAGVRYCQRSCAKAQSERDRRARRRAGPPP